MHRMDQLSYRSVVFSVFSRVIGMFDMCEQGSGLVPGCPANVT